MERTPSKQHKTGIKSSSTTIMDLNASEDVNNVTLRQSKKKQCNCNCADISRSFNTFQNELKGMLDMWKNEQFSQISELQSAMNYMKTQITDINKTNQELEKSMEFLTAAYDDTKIKITSMEEKSAHQESRIKLLERALEEQNRTSINNFVEIRNVPCKPKETEVDLINVVQEILKTVAVDPKTIDILDIRRLPSSTEKKTILVALKSVMIKNTVLQAVKNYNARNKLNKLNTTNIYPGSKPEPVYVDEHLTVKGKRLYYLARQLTKTGQFKFCWTANARVLLREKEGSKIIIITEESQISNLVTKE